MFLPQIYHDFIFIRMECVSSQGRSVFSPTHRGYIFSEVNRISKKLNCRIFNLNVQCASCGTCNQLKIESNHYQIFFWYFHCISLQIISCLFLLQSLNWIQVHLEAHPINIDNWDSFIWMSSSTKIHSFEMADFERFHREIL